MNLTFAVADLHGAHDLFASALEEIWAYAADAPDGTRNIVFLGDYIDRGPKSREIIEGLMAGPPVGWHWTCLKGNHEDMLIETLRAPLRPDWWIDNGGDATLASYGHTLRPPWRLDIIPAAHAAWMAARPLLAVDTHRVYVHAGIDSAKPLDAQIDHHLMWSRHSNQLGHEGRFVVHGHTPHRDGPVTDGQSIDLDTLAWKTGRLAVGVFDDDHAGGPTDLIEVTRRAR